MLCIVLPYIAARIAYKDSVTLQTWQVGTPSTRLDYFGLHIYSWNRTVTILVQDWYKLLKRSRQSRFLDSGLPATALCFREGLTGRVLPRSSAAAQVPIPLGKWTGGSSLP